MTRERGREKAAKNIRSIHPEPQKIAEQLAAHILTELGDRSVATSLGEIAFGKKPRAIRSSSHANSDKTLPSALMLPEARILAAISSLITKTLSTSFRSTRLSPYARCRA